MYNKKLEYQWGDFAYDCVSFDLKSVVGIDAVLAITNGGFFLGALLAVKYKLPFFTIRAQSYKGKKQGNLVIDTVPSILKDKSVLLVDDILDSGKTLRNVIKVLKKSKVKVKCKFVLFKRVGVSYKCRYMHKVKKGIWVVFPWER